MEPIEIFFEKAIRLFVLPVVLFSFAQKTNIHIHV